MKNEKVKYENFEPITSFLDPKVKINGIKVEECKLLKSKAKPVLINFKIQDSQKDHCQIYKKGDDVR